MDVYDELGVKKIINCAGTYTIIGGSRMSKATLEAMNEAAHSHVVIQEMQQAVYGRIAALTKNEAACVTPGAMAGLYLTMASCVSMKYQKAFKFISKQDVANAEIIMFRAHRNPYDRGLEVLGVKLVELGYPNNISIVTEEELENAITDRTAAILYLPSCDGGWVPPGALNFEATVKLAKQYRVPLVVDAAAQLPPKSNFWTFTQAGASAIVFSGGKDLKGPQTTGLVLGRMELLQWVHANSFPNYGIGRLHKVGREELAGIYLAVKQYIEADEDERREACERVVSRYAESFTQKDGLHFERAWPNEAGQPIARAKLIITSPALTVEGIEAELAQNNPSIYVRIENGCIYINPMTITLDEAELVLGVFKKINERVTNE